MFKRNSVYRSSSVSYSTENFNNDAMAAANALGKALVNNGRHVDRTKLPVYNSPQLTYSTSNLNKTGNAVNLNKRYSSLNSSNNNNTNNNHSNLEKSIDTNRLKVRISNKENITNTTHNPNPIPKKKTLKRTTSQIINRRTSSLPNNRHSLTSDNKLLNITYKQQLEAKRTFQEFGGKQTVSKSNNFPHTNLNVNSNNKQKFIKKYIPGPNGLMAVQVPVEEIERRNSLIERRNSLRFNSLNSLKSNTSNNSSNSYNGHIGSKNTLKNSFKRHSLVESSKFNNLKKKPINKKHFNDSSSNLNSTSYRQQQLNNETNTDNSTINTSPINNTNINKSPIKDSQQPLIESLVEEETELELKLDHANINMNADMNNDNIKDNNNNNYNNNHDQMLNDLLKENVISENKLSESDKEFFEDVEELESQQKEDKHKEQQNKESGKKDSGKKVELKAEEGAKEEVKEGVINEPLTKPELLLTHKDSASSYVTTQDISDLEMDEKEVNSVDEDLSDEKEQDVIGTTDKISDENFATEENEIETDSKQDNKASNSSHNPFVVPPKNPKRTSSLNYKKMIDNDTLIINEKTDDTQNENNDQTGNNDAVLNVQSTENENELDHTKNKSNMASYLRSMNPYLINQNDTNKNEHSNDELVNNNNSAKRIDSSATKKIMTPNKSKTTKSVPAKASTIKSTPKSASAKSVSAKSTPMDKIINNNNTIDKDVDHLKPPKKSSSLKNNNKTPIKSALKKTPRIKYSQHDSTSSSPYSNIKNSPTTAEGAYLKLTTAENTRLNAQLSSENLLRKKPTKRIVRSQSMMNHNTSNQSANNKLQNNKSTATNAVNGKNISAKTNNSNAATSTNVKRFSQIPKSKSTNLAKRSSQVPKNDKRSTSEVQKTAKQMANDPNLASILFPVEPPQRKSSFEKLRTKEDHLGFKNLSLRQDIMADELYGQSNMNNNFHNQPSMKQSNASSSSQRRNSNSSYGNEQNAGFLSGFSSRFQDSDDEDGFLPPPTPNYSYNSNGSNGARSRSDSFKFGSTSNRKDSNDYGSSPNKEKKSSGFSLFKKHSNNKAHSNNDLHLNQPNGGNRSTVHSPSPSKLYPSSNNSYNQSRSGSNHSHANNAPSYHHISQSQRSTSAPNMPRASEPTKEHKPNKLGTKLKKLFGRSH